jgi:hypothetical protein
VEHAPTSLSTTIFTTYSYSVQLTIPLSLSLSLSLAALEVMQLVSILARVSVKSIVFLDFVRR